VGHGICCFITDGFFKMKGSGKHLLEETHVHSQILALLDLRQSQLDDRPLRDGARLRCHVVIDLLQFEAAAGDGLDAHHLPRRNRVVGALPARQIEFEKAARIAGLVQAGALGRAAVTHPWSHIDSAVIMAQSDIVEEIGVEEREIGKALLIELSHAKALGLGPDAMRDEQVAHRITPDLDAPAGDLQLSAQGAVRDGVDIQTPEREPAVLSFEDAVDVREECKRLENGAGAADARGFMVAGDHDHGDPGRADPLDSRQRHPDRPVARSRRMEKIAGMNNQVGLQRDNPVYTLFPGVIKVLLPLVEPGARRYFPVFGIAQMGIRKMADAFRRQNSSSAHLLNRCHMLWHHLYIFIPLPDGFHSHNGGRGK